MPQQSLKGASIASNMLPLTLHSCALCLLPTSRNRKGSVDELDHFRAVALGGAGRGGGGGAGVGSAVGGGAGGGGGAGILCVCVCVHNTVG